MNIIKIALCILTLTLPFNVSGFENQETAKIPVSAINETAFEQGNQQNTVVKTTSVVPNRRTITQSSVEEAEVDFFTKFCLSLIIIMVYWLYWLINC
jgi:hypothetical protein